MYNKSFEKIKTDSISFVLKREKEKGGFAGTPLLPATIEDTYFAIKILNLLNFPVNEKHKTFLLTQKINTLSLYPLALLLKLLKRLFLLEALNKSSFEFIIRFLQQKMKSKNLFLKDYKALSEIFKILDLKDEISYLKSKILKILNLDELKIKTVRDVYFLGKIFQNCEIPKNYFLKDYLELILNAQN